MLPAHRHTRERASVQYILRRMQGVKRYRDDSHCACAKALLSTDEVESASKKNFAPAWWAVALTINGWGRPLASRRRAMRARAPRIYITDALVFM